MPYFIQNRLSACLFPSTLDERLPIAKGRNAVIQHINKNSPLPIYYQIEAALKQQIENGVLQPGDLIPSEREFAEAHQISRMTVRQAISNLVNAGYLIRQKGRGTFVANKKIVMQLSGLTSFSEEMEHLGLEPTSALLSYQIIDASMTIANKLRIREGASVYELKRLRIADEQALALETVYIPEQLLPGLDQDVATASLYAFAEASGLNLGRASQTFESRLATKEEAGHLGLSTASPVLSVEQLTYLATEQPFEYVISAYRGDRYTFTVEMERQH